MTKVISELKNISESIKKKGHLALAAEIDFIILKHGSEKSILSKLYDPESEYSEVMEALASLENSLIKVASRENKKK
jgi:hypothetical protein